MPACNSFTVRPKHVFSIILLFRTHQNKLNFQIGDKVCCTRNGYVTDKDKEDEAKGKKDDMDRNKSKKERLCNGEIFFIIQVVWKNRQRFDFRPLQDNFKVIII